MTSLTVSEACYAQLDLSALGTVTLAVRPTCACLKISDRSFRYAPAIV